ncbi:MAG: Uma2 family endonuclease [Chloroherpetonaceae bacterium]|nr:Uma2 family endonuclease [Chloroherpetonaceae bacterium]
MTTVAAAEKSKEKVFTARDLDRVQKQTGRNFYLIKGKLVEVMPAIIAQNIAFELQSHIRQHDLGFCVATETGFKLPIPNTVIAPDFGFIAKERLPKDCKRKGYGDVVPDFVVEVKSPSDSLSKALEKVNLWLESGVKLVWLINPETETITAFSQNHVARFKGDETISAEPILKKFRKKTSDFFK